MKELDSHSTPLKANKLPQTSEFRSLRRAARAPDAEPREAPRSRKRPLAIPGAMLPHSTLDLQPRPQPARMLASKVFTAVAPPALADAPVQLRGRTLHVGQRSYDATQRVLYFGSNHRNCRFWLNAPAIEFYLDPFEQLELRNACKAAGVRTKRVERPASPIRAEVVLCTALRGEMLEPQHRVELSIKRTGLELGLRPQRTLGLVSLRLRCLSKDVSSAHYEIESPAGTYWLEFDGLNGLKFVTAMKRVGVRVTAVDPIGQGHGQSRPDSLNGSGSRDGAVVLEVDLGADDMDIDADPDADGRHHVRGRSPIFDGESGHGHGSDDNINNCMHPDVEDNDVEDRRIENDNEGLADDKDVHEGHDDPDSGTSSSKDREFDGVHPSEVMFVSDLESAPLSNASPPPRKRNVLLQKRLEPLDAGRFYTSPVRRLRGADRAARSLAGPDSEPLSSPTRTPTRPPTRTGTPNSKLSSLASPRASPGVDASWVVGQQPTKSPLLSSSPALSDQGGDAENHKRHDLPDGADGAGELGAKSTPPSVGSQRQLRSRNRPGFSAEDFENVNDVVEPTLEDVRALGEAGFSNVLYTFWDGKRIAVRLEDIVRLNDHVYVNDTIIWFFMKLYMEALMQHSPRNADSVLMLDTFFCYTLQKAAKPGVETPAWIAKIPLRDKHVMIMPVHEQFHWSLIVVIGLDDAIRAAESGDTPVKPTIVSLDSLMKQRARVRKAVTILKRVFVAQNLKPLTVRDFDCVLATVPLQSNCTDCGVYLLHYVERIMQDLPRFVGICTAYDSAEDAEFWDPSALPTKRASLKERLKLLGQEFPEASDEEGGSDLDDSLEILAESTTVKEPGPAGRRKRRRRQRRETKLAQAASAADEHVDLVTSAETSKREPNSAGSASLASARDTAFPGTSAPDREPSEAAAAGAEVRAEKANNEYTNSPPPLVDSSASDANSATPTATPASPSSTPAAVSSSASPIPGDSPTAPATADATRATPSAAHDAASGAISDAAIAASNDVTGALDGAPRVTPRVTSGAASRAASPRAVTNQSSSKHTNDVREDVASPEGEPVVHATASVAQDSQEGAANSSSSDSKPIVVDLNASFASDDGSGNEEVRNTRHASNGITNSDGDDDGVIYISRGPSSDAAGVVQRMHKGRGAESAAPIDLSRAAAGARDEESPYAAGTASATDTLSSPDEPITREAAIRSTFVIITDSTPRVAAGASANSVASEVEVHDARLQPDASEWTMDVDNPAGQNVNEPITSGVDTPASASLGTGGGVTHTTAQDVGRAVHSVGASEDMDEWSFNRYMEHSSDSY